MLFCVCSARNKTQYSRKYQYTLYTAHKTFHCESFRTLQSNILKYECKRCGVLLQGFAWKECTESKLNSGHAIVYHACCNRCKVCSFKHVSSPRVIVDLDEEKSFNIQQSKTQSDKASTHWNTYSLYSLLQSIILLQHGTTITQLQTISSVFDLPPYGSKTVTREARCAANILKYVAKQSIKEA